MNIENNIDKLENQESKYEKWFEDFLSSDKIPEQKQNKLNKVENKFWEVQKVPEFLDAKKEASEQLETSRESFIWKIKEKDKELGNFMEKLEPKNTI
jgi:predicted nucleotide-binding protein (sugar kinase/HSP70/actin superfamily)